MHTLPLLYIDNRDSLLILRFANVINGFSFYSNEGFTEKIPAAYEWKANKAHTGTCDGQENKNSVECPPVAQEVLQSRR